MRSSLLAVYVQTLTPLFFHGKTVIEVTKIHAYCSYVWTRTVLLSLPNPCSRHERSTRSTTITSVRDTKVATALDVLPFLKSSGHHRWLPRYHRADTPPLGSPDLYMLLTSTTSTLRYRAPYTSPSRLLFRPSSHPH